MTQDAGQPAGAPRGAADAAGTVDAAGAGRAAPLAAVAGEHVIDLIPAGDGRLDPVPGGGPANIAVATARLGTPTLLLSRFGTDSFAERLRARMSAESVDLSRCPVGPGSSALALAGIGPDGSARYDFWLADAPDWRWSPDELADALPDSVRVLHLGSIAALRPPGDAVLLEFARRERARRTVTFDPNVRLATLPGADHARARTEEFCRVSHLVKASDADLAELYPGESAESAAARLLALGPRAVVVTRGGEGAFALSAEGRARAAAPPVAVRDTIGAGDTFMAALIAGCAAAGGAVPTAPGELEALLATAARAAAITCTRPGADPPTARELAGFAFAG
ncbi:PfkB family carbohydrate kinase [Streptomonospora sp. S1-112]|uniref:PfkB family carbohydrate kinase n=1 Tax=Streptomonospora mangrovi TaxID=2883123 RepID=A0A9X3SG27_9ACTN|nr:PfkB family carbohydrate kinase [Streptomonospora mangrovi]MDA0567463.1 PfkB family carbohydrate kinase [Streptomonospora mangrovi]